MIAVFDIWSFKDIQKVCSPALADNEDRITLTYMCLEFTDGLCRAYGSNGFQVSKIEVPCKLSVKGLYSPVKVLLRPVKIPPKTKRVIISTDDPENIYITFYGPENDCVQTGEIVQPVLHAEPLEFEDKIIKPALENIDKYNHGQGAYMIAVNPQYLLAALAGMKDCDSVIFNFASPNNSFTIRPYEGEQNITALVFPVRT